METLRLIHNGEKYGFSQTFIDPGIERSYKAMRDQREMTFLPRLTTFVLMAGIVVRRAQLLILAYYGATVASFHKELLLSSITLVATFMELITHMFSRLASLRCVPMTLVSFYLAADGTITYYLGRVHGEPTFPYGYTACC
ncbi:MAG: hypothetical protein P4M11_04525 [Candidatus Pacebacteria bacterium]|nr:hypothetical protein [Candidatus Paceibacterota bacterium]